MRMELNFPSGYKRETLQMGNFSTPVIDITQWNNPIKVMKVQFNDRALRKEAAVKEPEVITSNPETPAYLSSYYLDGKMYDDVGSVYDAYMAKYSQTVTYKSQLADIDKNHVNNGRAWKALDTSDLQYRILKEKGLDIDYDTVATYYLNMGYEGNDVYVKDGLYNIYGSEKGSTFVTGLQQTTDVVKKQAEYITNSQEYKDMLAKGGTASLEDIAVMQAACDFYSWQEAYKKYDVYTEDVFSFADTLKEKTGVYVTTYGMNAQIGYKNGGKECTMDNDVFQLMANHQEHMDIWEDVVTGKYRNFQEIGQAIEESGDDALVAEWEEVLGFACKDRYKSFSRAALEPSSGAYLAGANQAREDASTLPKEWWNEFRYNIGEVADLHGNKEVTINQQDWMKILQKVDDIEGEREYRKMMKETKSAQPESDKEMDSLGNIREHISMLRGKLQRMQKSSMPAAVKQAQVKRYQQQIDALQGELIEATRAEISKQMVNLYA